MIELIKKSTLEEISYFFDITLNEANKFLKQIKDYDTKRKGKRVIR